MVLGSGGVGCGFGAEIWAEYRADDFGHQSKPFHHWKAGFAIAAAAFLGEASSDGLARSRLLVFRVPVVVTT